MSKVQEVRSGRTSVSTNSREVSEDVANDRATRVAFYIFAAAIGASVIALLLMPLFIG